MPASKPRPASGGQNVGETVVRAIRDNPLQIICICETVIK